MSANAHHFATRVPHHEVGAFGEVRPAALLRLLQEAAIEASTAAGYPERWYRDGATQWVVRRTCLDFATPLFGGEPVDVGTWVADFRRVRSRREYALTAGDRLVARGWSDWVYVDLRRGRPLRVPPEMVTAFRPALGDAAHEREALEIGAAPASAFLFERTVALRDLDGLGHANNAALVDLLEETLVAALDAAGHPLERLAGEGPFPRLAALDVEYLDEARFGERLEARLWEPEEAGSAPWRTAFEIRRRGGSPALRARAAWCWIDAASGAAGSAPASIRAAASFVS